MDPDGKDTFSKGIASVREQEGTCHKKKGCDEGAARRPISKASQSCSMMITHGDHPMYPRTPQVIS